MDTKDYANGDLQSKESLCESIPHWNRFPQGLLGILKIHLNSNNKQPNQTLNLSLLWEAIELDDLQKSLGP